MSRRRYVKNLRWYLLKVYRIGEAKTIYNKSKSWYTLVTNSGVAFRSTLGATDYIYMYSVVLFICGVSIKI